MRYTMPKEHCIETFAVADSSVLRLPPAQRRTVVAGITKHADRFAPGSLTGQAPISLAEEAAVLLAFFVLMGGPLTLLVCGTYLLLLGSWTGCAIHVLVTLGLMFHPMPEVADAMRESWFMLSVYRYFSYRFVWSGDDDQASLASAAWIGAGPPHGVLPLANIISVSALNSFLGRHFVGAPASVVFRTPFLRYMTLLGCVDVAGKSIARATGAGVCVGMVPDGIAGIFRICGEEDEVVYLKERKGLAKHALRTGTPSCPPTRSATPQSTARGSTPGASWRRSRAGRRRRSSCTGAASICRCPAASTSPCSSARRCMSTSHPSSSRRRSRWIGCTPSCYRPSRRSSTGTSTRWAGVTRKSASSKDGGGTFLVCVRTLSRFSFSVLEHGRFYPPRSLIPTPRASTRFHAVSSGCTPSSSLSLQPCSCAPASSHPSTQFERLRRRR